MISFSEDQDYKKSELGYIPKDWEIQTLGDVANFSNGKAHEEYVASDGRYILVNSKYVSSEGLVRKMVSKNLSPLRKDDIVMVMSDVPNGKAIAKCLYIDHDIAYALNQRICAIRACQVESKFLFYILNRNTFYLSFDNGVGQTNLRKDEVLSCPIPLPPIPEQKKIAEILSTWDAAIEKLDQLIEKKKLLKKGLMQQLLTGKKRFPGFTEEWKDVKLGDLGEIYSGGTPDTENQEFWNGEFQWCTPTEITRLKGHPFIGNTDRAITKKGVENSSAKVLPPGCLIVCTRATVGAMAINTVEMTTNQGFKSIVPKSVDIEFVYYSLTFNQRKLTRVAAGSTFMEVSKKDFEKISLVVPRSQEEQKRIAEILGASDQELNLFSAKRILLIHQKKGLMQQLLTGKTRVKVS